jgi:hypothetical protein
MKTLILFCIAFLSIYYLSCDKINSADDNSRINNLLFPDHLDQDSKNPGKIILANGSNPSQWKMDHYTVDSVFIIGDSIHFNITFGGGCKTHDFLLAAYNYFMESYPVQAGILLSHDSNSDFCKALLTRNIAVDLSPLKQVYQNLYHENSGRIELSILFSMNEAKRIEYKF